MDRPANDEAADLSQFLAAGHKIKIFPGIIAQKPAEHFIKIDGVRSDLSTLICDRCGNPIPDGSPAIAYTAWRFGQEPRRWENDYQARTEPGSL
jgi:hypothetical protein